MTANPAAADLALFRATVDLRARESRPPQPRLSGAALYRDDPLAFAHNCINWRDGEALAPYQEEILAELPRRKRVAVRGPHGLGKTALEAIVLLWFSLTRDGEDWKAPTLASVWRQLTKYLWPEVRKWTRRLRWDKLGRAPFNLRTELLGLSLKLGSGEAFAMATDDSELIEGAHATHLLYLFDESKAIPTPIFDAAEGAFSGAGSDTVSEALALCCSTPGEPSGRFYEIHKRQPGTEDWWVRHVTMDEAIRAGRMSGEWAEQRRRQWGEHSAVYQNRVLGEFAASSEDSIIPLAWVEAANDRWREWTDARQQGAFVCLGVDVGGGGEDPSVIAVRIGNAIAELRRFPHEDTMQLTGQVKAMLDAYGGYAVVDEIGVGTGSVHRLREQGNRVVAFIAGSRTEMRDASREFGMLNARAGGWWTLRERLHPQATDPIALPPDDLLIGDLTAPRWWVTSNGRIQVEGKDEIRRRLGRSTNDGDAVMQAFFPLATGGDFQGAQAALERAATDVRAGRHRDDARRDRPLSAGWSA